MLLDIDRKFYVIRSYNASYMIKLNVTKHLFFKDDLFWFVM